MNGKQSVARQDAQLPLARAEGLVIEELGDELLVYDLDVKHAHCLTPTAARVWKSCDGKTARDELASLLSIDADEVSRALDELESSGLFEAQVPAPLANGHTRRDFGFKVAKVTAASATLPLVLSIAAPAAAQSSSVIQFCFDKTGPGGTNNCNICNEPTGDNTLCCCCHKPDFLPNGQPFNPPSPAFDKLCAPDGTFCENVLGGDECTENNNPVTP